MTTNRLKIWTLFFVLCLFPCSFAQAEIKTFVAKQGAIDSTQGKKSVVGAGLPCSTVKDIKTQAATAYIAAFAVSLRNYFELRDGAKVSNLEEGLVVISVKGELGDFQIYSATAIREYNIVLRCFIKNVKL